MKPKNSGEVVNVLTRACAFCNGQVSMGDDAKSGHGVLLHTMPPCPKFVQLEPQNFVEAMFRAFALARKEE